MDPSAAADTKSPTGAYINRGPSGTWSGMMCGSCSSQARVAAKRRHGTITHTTQYTPSTPARSHDTTWHGKSRPLYDVQVLYTIAELQKLGAPPPSPGPLLFKTRIPPNPTPTAPQKTNKTRNPPSASTPPRLHPENKSHGLAAKRILHGPHRRRPPYRERAGRLVSRVESLRFF